MSPHRLERAFVTEILNKGGKFDFSGKVIYKTENLELGKFLWDFVANLPWSLIYFLDNVKRIDIRQPVLVSTLGYMRNDRVRGVRKVKRKVYRVGCQQTWKFEEVHRIVKLSSLPSPIPFLEKQKRSYDN